MNNCWKLCGLIAVVTGVALAGLSTRVLAQESPERERPGPRQEFREQRPPPPGAPAEMRGACPGHPARARCAMAWRLVVAAILVCHLLLAVWVFQDIRKRGEGNGLFIVLALLAGFCGAILYALVRIGDKKA